MTAPPWLVGGSCSEASLVLLRASALELSEPKTREEWIAKGPLVHVLCPSSTTFDAAEALRLELVANAPGGVLVDVEIAEDPTTDGGGELSMEKFMERGLDDLRAENAAGRRLFAAQRAERLAGPPGCGCSSPDLAACATCSPEHENYCDGYACAACNAPPPCACHASKPPAPDPDAFPWDEGAS